jgi:hypothetical protein
VIPLWFKIGYTVFTAAIVAIWLRHYGPRNLLWLSDVALIGAVPAMWLEDARIGSVLAVAVLLPELLWNLDFVVRIVSRRRFTGLTDYMFEPERPWILRALSLFHVPLPLVMLWLLYAYGYDEHVALPGAIALAAVVLPWSRVVSPVDKNINWTHGLGSRPAAWPAVAYVPALWLGFVLVVFVPTDLALRSIFG